MFYKAKGPETGNMWDVWLYHHEGTYHLYSLSSSGPSWDNISTATSPDGVHWTERGPVLRRRPSSSWMGSGSTWRSPRFEEDGRFFMNFSSSEGPTRRQTIFFAESADLVNWTRLGDEYEFVQDERWYEREGRWDCIWTIERPEGGLYGYWTATPKPGTGGRFGLGESLDGVTWKALEPPKVDGVGVGEVGAVEEVGGRYVMLYGCDMRMVTLVADGPRGPFAPAPGNRVVLGGHTYFARFFRSPSGLLVCHHSIARDGQVSAGLLKGTDFDAEGTLRLTWWPGNDALKHEPVAVAPPADTAGPIAMLGRELDAGAGFLLEGGLELPEPLGAPRGLYVEHGRGVGTAVLLDSDGRAELGPVGEDGVGFRPEKTVDRETRFGSPARFRLALQGVLMEVYLDDLLIECYSLPAPATGRVGLIRGSEWDSIGALEAWR